MERIVRLSRLCVGVFILSFMGTLPSAQAKDELGVVPGVITADNVDVTYDDGSLLTDRLGVGNNVYIILKPKIARKGWVRISRSAEDNIGIGWVEAKNIQRYADYRSTGAGAGKGVTNLTSVEKKMLGRIAVLPFVTAESGSSVGRSLFGEFSEALKGRKQFEIVTDIPVQGVNVESEEQVRRVLISHQLDGVLVGKLSAIIGGSRLLQVKYLGKSGDSFAFEKMKRIPNGGDSRKLMKELADTCATNIPSP